MKVLILRDTVADGRDVFSGKVEDVSDHDAKQLIRMGKARATEDEVDPLEEVEPKKVLSTSNGPEAKKPGRPPKKV